MLDIVLALEWVKDNIENFGGDPNNVTIFGQSGGGTKVLTLMAMPSAKGLFHKAICQSNSILQVSVPEYAQKLSQFVLDELEIKSDNLDTINKVPFQKIIEAGLVAERKAGSAVPKNVGRPGWQPVVDGKILPTHPFDPTAPALSANIPFMVGSTRNEASVAIDNFAVENITEEELKGRIKGRFPGKGTQIYETLRKVHPTVKPADILTYISAQNAIAFLAAERKAAQNTAPVFLYRFDWQTKILDGRPRAFHCSEIPFAFANTAIAENYTGATKEAATLAEKMSKAWINFARIGNPNHAGLPKWSDFRDKKGATMIFDKVSRVETDPDGQARNILERAFYNKEV
jgi:para-nitrobenzyl esterase